MGSCALIAIRVNKVGFCPVYNVAFFKLCASKGYQSNLPDLCGVVKAVKGVGVNGALRVVDENAAEQ